MQGQVTGGNQLAVLGNDDVVIIIKVYRVNGNIAFLRHSMTVYRDYAVCHKQVNVFSGGNGIFYCHFTNVNIALFRADRHASIVRSYGSLNRRISFACGYAYIVTRLDLPGSVSLADRGGTVGQCQRHIALPCDNIMVYSNIAFQYVSQHTVFRHNTGVVCHVSLIGQRHHTAAGFHMFIIIDIA